MCGIAVTISEAGQQPSTAALSDESLLARRGPDHQGVVEEHAGRAVLQLIASLLQLRGCHPQLCPLRDASSGSVLCFNGELFGGSVAVERGANDAAALLEALLLPHTQQQVQQDQVPASQQPQLQQPGTPLKQHDGPATSLPGGRAHQVLSVLSTLHGPWSLAFWDAPHQSLFFGRDMMGRRSLLARFPSQTDPSFVLTSVAPPGSRHTGSQEGASDARASQSEEDQEEAGAGSCHQFGHAASEAAGAWQEVPPGLYCLRRLPTSSATGAPGEGPKPDGRNMSDTGGESSTLAGVLSCGGEPWELRTYSWPPGLASRLAAYVRPQGTGTPAPHGALLPPAEAHASERLSAGAQPGNTGGAGEASQLPLVDQQLSGARPSKGPRAGTVAAALKAASASGQSPLEQLQAACAAPQVQAAAARALQALRAAVAVRCQCIEQPVQAGGSAQSGQVWKGGPPGESPRQGTSYVSDAPVLLLFSGGVDSTLLAALTHEALTPGVPIDLANICFDGGKSPDRKAALSALQELAAYGPSRPWRLIEVDASLADVDKYKDHLLNLLHPAGTVMDLNIGAALWLAVGATGTLRLPQQQAGSSSAPGPPLPDSPQLTTGQPYTSGARVVLLGHGADEQCAGYGRHRTRFVSGGPQGLADELALDVRRLWVRNLGRDDRLVADWGREGRHPFLDETFMDTLLDTPLSHIADLTLPPGVGDKLMLRGALLSLGMTEAATRVKRAIQFGSRIGKLSNVREFGSNRAANKASAGSVALGTLAGQK